jgi:N-acetylglucosamine malate deacetylase 1
VSVLVIAPHPDDEAIGCGGTVAKHCAGGERVEVVFLTSGELALSHMEPEDAWQIREHEAQDAAAVLGIAELTFMRLPDWGLSDSNGGAAALARQIERVSPTTIYAPHPGDWHPDHRAAAELARGAGRDIGLSPEAVLGYEIWTPLSEYTIVEDVGDVFPIKLDAIRCYVSQSDHFDYVGAAEGIGKYRGALAGRCAYAEVFASIAHAGP